MSVLELSDDQVISLMRQLPAARKRTALLALAQDAQVRRQERMRFGEAQLRQASAERGLNWDRLPEDEREAFVNDLLFFSGTGCRNTRRLLGLFADGSF